MLMTTELLRPGRASGQSFTLPVPATPEAVQLGDWLTYTVTKGGTEHSSPYQA
jgi:hypothetical protein